KRAYCLKTQPATGETYPKSDLFNKATLNKTARNQGKDNPHSGSCEPFNYFYFQRWFGLYIFFLMDSSSVFK
ncbi:hypothetical protein NQ359_21855, partial [Escherichia coli]|nr:hypothetical protein [Escherichia coli]